MTMGGPTLLGLRDRSRLGEESRDEGLEDSERGEMGLGWRQLGESSVTVFLFSYKLTDTIYLIY